MKLVLVDNLLFTGSISRPVFDLQPNLGLMSLVAVCRNHGYGAEIYDPKSDLKYNQISLDSTIYSYLAQAIINRTPTVVGMTTLGCNFHSVVRVARAIRISRPEIPIILGGPHATILHREILERFPVFNAVIRGEAEETIIKILPRLLDKSLHGIEGISFRTNDQVIECGPPSNSIHNLDELPIPAYDAYPIEQLGFTTLRIEAGRGCPFSCTFCSTASFFGRNYRLKSPERLRSEMNALNQRYGISDFKLNHDLFTVDRKKVLAFCEVIRDDGFTWGCSARVDCVDEGLLTAMYEAGCRSIYFGIEAGSARIQRTSRKRLDLSLVKPILDITEKLGIKTTTSFITGFPDENRSDFRATLDMVGELHVRPRGINTSQLHLLTPEPGTRLIEELRHELQLDHHISGFNFPRFDPADDLLLSSNQEVFQNHFHYPTLLPRERHVNASFLWYEVSQLGHQLIEYLLRHFNGSFDLFADVFYKWRIQNAFSGHLTTVELSSFFEAQLFKGHHIISLLRYSYSIRSIRKKASQNDEVLLDLSKQDSIDSEPWQRPLILKEEVKVLLEIHDCIQLLERIAKDSSGQLLDDSGIGPIGDELIVMGESGFQRYQIDLPTRELINTFNQPMSYFEACQSLTRKEGLPLPVWEDITELLKTGVLQFADTYSHKMQPI